MKRLLLIPVLLLTTVSCQTKTTPIAAKTDKEMVQGEWVLAGFKTDPTATGNLTLNADNTFTGKIGSAKSKKPFNDSFSGTFVLSRTNMTGQNLLFIDLQITTLSGKPAASGMGMRFSYDPGNNILTDLLMMCYARPSEVNKVKKLLEDSRRAAQARRGPGK